MEDVTDVRFNGVPAIIDNLDDLLNVLTLLTCLIFVPECKVKEVQVSEYSNYTVMLHHSAFHNIFEAILTKFQILA